MGIYSRLTGMTRGCQDFFAPLYLMKNAREDEMLAHRIELDLHSTAPGLRWEEPSHQSTCLDRKL
jgi:hypothetical protein